MIDSAILYIKNNFGVKIIEKDLYEINNLPLYLSKGYEYKVITFLNKSFILANKNNNENLSFDILDNHILKINSFLNVDYPIILVLNSVNTYLRKQLINERVSFIVPGKMIFIFELGSVFYERQRSNYIRANDSSLSKMTPSSQALFLYLITTNNFDSSMDIIAKQLDLTKMSVSRGFNDLYSLGIIEKNDYEDGSKYRFKRDKKDIWIDAQEYMINPVIKTVFLHKKTVESRNDQFIISGESALSRFSMISEPKSPIYGMTRKHFKKVNLNNDELYIYEENPVMVQLFKHTLPKIDYVLHPLSIALVLKDENDPRVRKEVETMLDNYFNNEDTKWHKVMR